MSILEPVFGYVKGLDSLSWILLSSKSSSQHQISWHQCCLVFSFLFFSFSFSFFFFHYEGLLLLPKFFHIEYKDLWNWHWKWLLLRPETAAFPPVTLDGELLLDCPHHTILHPLRVVSHPPLLILVLQLFPLFLLMIKMTPKMAPMYSQIPSLFTWLGAYKCKAFEGTPRGGFPFCSIVWQ